MAKIKIEIPTKADKDVEEIDCSYIAAGKQSGSFYKTKHVFTICVSNHILRHLSQRNGNSHKNLYIMFIAALFIVTKN